MPSKLKQLQFRVPWLRVLWGERADFVAKAIFAHPSIRESLEADKCPICGKSFNQCEYLERIEE